MKITPHGFNGLEIDVGQIKYAQGGEIEIDEVGPFWVVTYPTSDIDELNDILFQSTIASMCLQFLGGLKLREIAGIYREENVAKQRAIDLMIGVRESF